MQIDPGTVIKVNPYNALGYGLLVLVLLIACGKLWVTLISERKDSVENLKNTQGVLYQVTEYMKNEGTHEANLKQHDHDVKLLMHDLVTKLDNLKN